MNRRVLPLGLSILVHQERANTLSKLWISHDVGAQPEFRIEHFF